MRDPAGSLPDSREKNDAPSPEREAALNGLYATSKAAARDRMDYACDGGRSSAFDLRQAGQLSPLDDCGKSLGNLRR